MKYRRRIYYSATQRAEIWDRWQRGESMSSIGRVFDRQSSSVFSVISPTGGIRPPGRRRGSRALSLSEREEISRGLSIKRSLRVIAHQLGRAPSTISREVRRNGGSANYRATTSDQAAWDRALRPKTCKLACHPALAQAVSAKLRRKWSPEQIAGWLKRTFPKKAQKQVSHETIAWASSRQKRNGGSANYTSDQAAGSRIAPQDMQAGLPPSFGPSSIGKASAQVVTRADCGLAQAYVPEKSAETSVARNDIQKPLYTGARRTEEGVAGASARQTHCPALQACKPQAQRFGADQKRRIDQSKTRVRGRQSGARALGRRSDRRVEEQLYSDPSGTPFAVCDAGQSRQQGHRKRHLWANQIGTEIATRTLLLRPTLPVATRFERKHQPASPAISAKGN